MAAKPIVLCSNADHQFFPNSTGLCVFRVKAERNAEIALSNQTYCENPMYEIYIGANTNTETYILKNKNGVKVASVNTPNILSKDEYRGFWLRWGNRKLSFGREGEGCAFMTWYDTEDVPTKYIGFRTPSPIIGSWIIGDGSGPFPGEGCQDKGVWVASSDGNVPPNAFIGGFGEARYVVRCKYLDDKVPGKLVVKDKTAYFPAGGKEQATRQYEVLCDFNGGTWLNFTGTIPKNGLLAGNIGTAEPLYVGRVAFGEKEVQITGKVQRSDCKCYISLGGEQKSFDVFEILVC